MGPPEILHFYFRFALWPRDISSGVVLGKKHDFFLEGNKQINKRRSPMHLGDRCRLTGPTSIDALHRHLTWLAHPQIPHAWPEPGPGQGLLLLN